MGLLRMTPVTRPKGQDCLGLDSRSSAFTAASYTICSSLLVILLYGWRFLVNAHNPRHLQDVYWGVQIAYLATISSHMLLIILSCCLLVAINKERIGLVTQWVVINISLMALEAVCCCYSNVLRDHINKRFDVICKAELVFFISRIFFSIVSIWSVIKFLKSINSGVSYRSPESIEL